MKTILLAEDEEPTIALFQAMVVGHEQWRLLIARTGAEALAMAIQQRPDVALLDIQIPAPDGLEICRAIKTAPETAGTYVVVVSAMTQAASRADAVAAGADDFVAKPFSTTEFTELLVNSIGE
jgi:CheY-like chemotaxis protein